MEETCATLLIPSSTTSGGGGGSTGEVRAQALALMVETLQMQMESSFDLLHLLLYPPSDPTAGAGAGEEELWQTQVMNVMERAEHALSKLRMLSSSSSSVWK